MNREELEALLAHHHMRMTWCDGCLKHVGRNHLIDLIMQQGVEKEN